MTEKKSIKTQDLLESKEALIEISQKNLQARSAYRMARVLKKCLVEIATIEEARNSLIIKYGEQEKKIIKKPDGTNEEQVTDKYFVKKDKMTSFIPEFNELMTTEISLESILPHTFKLKDLVDSEGKDIDITPAFLIQLDWLISE